MYILGLDIGSVASKALVINQKKQICATKLIYAIPSVESVERITEEVLKENNIKRNSLDYVLATGYGKGNVPFADKILSEIMCHALGVHHCLPSVRTIIDIGGQDSKTIRLDSSGKVLRFVMNDKCAAGTGRFLEVMSQALHIVFEKWGEYNQKAKKPATISSTCTVFAESEVISKVANRVPLEDIIAGVCTAISARVGSMAINLGIEPDVAITGGTAKNDALVNRLESRLEVRLLRTDAPQFTGALGAGLAGLREAQLARD